MKTIAITVPLPLLLEVTPMDYMSLLYLYQKHQFSIFFPLQKKKQFSFIRYNHHLGYDVHDETHPFWVHLLSVCQLWLTYLITFCFVASTSHICRPVLWYAKQTEAKSDLFNHLITELMTLLYNISFFHLPFFPLFIHYREICL